MLEEESQAIVTFFRALLRVGERKREGEGREGEREGEKKTEKKEAQTEGRSGKGREGHTGGPPAF